MIAAINRIIKAFIIKRASRHKAVDIVEVRTKQIGLLSVQSETDLLIKNSFFLPFTLLSIKTDLLNKDGLKVGKMNFDNPTKVKGHSELILTTTSEISIITSFFQALSNLLSHSIWMHSVGVATVKFLWFTIELPVDDVFEIHPSKLKILKDETEEERTIRLQKETERRMQRKKRAEEQQEKNKSKVEIIEDKKTEKTDERKEKRKAHRITLKEKILKRRFKDNYIPKDERNAMAHNQVDENKIPLIITIDEQKIDIETEDSSEEKTQPEVNNNISKSEIENKENQSTQETKDDTPNNI